MYADNAPPPPPAFYSKNPFGFESNEYIKIVNCGNLRLNEDSFINRPKGRKDYLLIYNISGQCHIKLNGEEIVAKQGEIVLFRPGEPQHYSFFRKESPHNYWIHFSGVACKKIFKIGGLENTHIIKPQQSAEIEYYLGKLCNHFHIDRFASETICNGLILAVLGLLCQYNIYDDSSPKSYKKDTRSEDLISEIISRIKLTDLIWMNASDAAEYCNLSLVHFSRIFKRVTGMPPQKYITKTRINRAKELLLYTGFNIGNIADMVGYRDQNYFSKIFKKEVGMLPSEYRKSNHH